MVHPAVLRKMRDYAIKQALSELSPRPDPKEIEKIAKRHLLSYPELKGAFNASKKTPDYKDGGQKD